MPTRDDLDEIPAKRGLPPVDLVLQMNAGTTQVVDSPFRETYVGRYAFLSLILTLPSHSFSISLSLRRRASVPRKVPLSGAWRPSPNSKRFLPVCLPTNPSGEPSRSTLYASDRSLSAPIRKFSVREGKGNFTLSEFEESERTKDDDLSGRCYRPPSIANARDSLLLHVAADRMHNGRPQY